MICQYMNQREYDGTAKIYGHAEVLSLLEDVAKKLLQPKETAFIATDFISFPLPTAKL